MKQTLFYRADVKGIGYYGLTGMLVLVLLPLWLPILGLVWLGLLAEEYLW